MESVTAPVEDSEVIKLETPSTNSDETEAKIASSELAAMKLQYEERIAALEQALTKAAPPQTSSESQAQQSTWVNLGVADSRYESPFLESYKTHYTSFIALPES